MADNNNANDDLTICVKRTQEILGKYVKKPSLTEKLLKKPPFRFLHDIIHVIIRDTGYFVGLYSEEELKSENIKDRDGKMNFLQKIIDVVKLTTNASLTARTSKIVAGLEPNKTNELLQLIGEIIDKQLNWKLAVETVIGQEQGPRKDHVPDQGQTDSKHLQDDTKKHLRVTKTDKDESKQSKHKTKLSEENVKDNVNKIRDKDKSTRKHGISNEKPSNKDSNNKRIKEKEKVQSKQTMVTKEKDIMSKDSNKSKEKPRQTKTTVKNVKAEVKLESPALTTNEATKEKQQQQQQNQQDQVALNKVNERKKSAENVSLETSPNETAVESQTPIEKKTETAISVDMPVLNTLNESVALAKEEASTLFNKNQMENVPQQNEKLKGEADNDESKNSPDFIVNHEPNNEHINDKHEQQLQQQQNESRNLESEELQNTESIKTTTTSAKSNAVKEASVMQTIITTTTTPVTKTIPTTTTPITKSNIRRQSTFTRIENNHVENGSNETVRPQTSSLRPPSARPPSARPGAPRRHNKNIEIILQPNEQIQMAGVNIKLDTYNNLKDVDDDGENLVIIETANSINDDNDVNKQTAANNTENENELDEQEDQGYLVQQILETQREFMQDNPELKQQKQEKNDKNLSKPLVTRQTSARTVNNLRDRLIELSKSINSLGKLLEFIPEDIDAMQLEITMWRDAYTQTTIELQKEKSLTESSTEPLKNQLAQIEANIVEYVEMIDSSRARILQNTEKIFHLYNAQ